jgi:hypothetical protein
MTGWNVPPDPYTDEQRANALPDDATHEPTYRTRWLGDMPYCDRLVHAPTTSMYGIRPCLIPSSEHRKPVSE